jgi:hypothetical protein
MEPARERRRGIPVSTWKDGIRTACTGGTLRIKNVSIMSSGGRKLCLRVEENCVLTEKFQYIYIYMYMYTPFP